MQIRPDLADPLHVAPATAMEEEDDEPPGSLGPHCFSLVPSLPLASGQLIRFPSPSVTDRTRTVKAFRKRFYPDIHTKLWNDWHWQVAHRIRTYEQLRAMLTLSPEEQAALTGPGCTLPLSITPYYMSLIDPQNPMQPIRRTVVPTIHETMHSRGEDGDPLAEATQSPVPGLVHRYPDRVLLLLSDFCSTYCRYCTRSRVVGHNTLHPGRKRLEQAFEYIRERTSIRDVLLSGGDPLLLSDEQLNWILSELRRIPHVEIIRIGTKVTTVLPQRITSRLTRMLRHHHPLLMSLHFIHPDECTQETHKACTMLADAGIPLGSQTVLLAGINDDVSTMRHLMHALLKMRVRPYYLYQCDPITGSAHFRTPVAKGISIIKGLRGHTSGYAVPTYVIDAPKGGGKIPLMPETLVAQDESGITIKNYEDALFRYPETCIKNTRDR